MTLEDFLEWSARNTAKLTANIDAAGVSLTLETQHHAAVRVVGRRERTDCEVPLLERRLKEMVQEVESKMEAGYK